MNDTDRIIGELKEFKRATLEDLRDLKRQVHELNSFRWRAAGLVAGLMGMVELAHMYLTGKSGQ